MPKGIKGFIKGESGNPNGRPLGALSKATLLREERRAIFDKEISERWLKVISQLPPTYIADQFLGKAPDKVDLNMKAEVKVTDPKALELARKYEEELKKSQ
jgi:hypothetical protein